MPRNKYPEETLKLIIDQARKLFIQNGYEKTSIQEIINHLGGLSKGAIYHHFKSKEEIFEAVCQQIGDENIAYYNKLRDDKAKNGLEKLKDMIRSPYSNPNNSAVVAMQKKITSDPKFLMNQIKVSYELVAPLYIEPIIREGIKDGSIQTDYPAELASALITLLNVWINPMIVKSTTEQLQQKLKFFAELFLGIGIDLMDSEMLEEYTKHFQQYQQN